MANSFHRIRKGISLTPTVLPVSGEVGDILCDIADNEIKRWDGLSWVKVGSGGGVVVVADTTERNNIPEDERTDCMLVGVVDNDTIYKLIGQPTGATTTDANWDQVITSANVATLTNKDIDGGAASNTSRITIPKGSIEDLAVLARKEGTLLYNTDDKKLIVDDGTKLSPVPVFDNLDVFSQDIASDSSESDWTFISAPTDTSSFEISTSPVIGKAFKFSFSSPFGGSPTLRKTSDYPVPHTMRGQRVQMTYDYLSDIQQGGIAWEIVDQTNSVVIVSGSDQQAKPDPSGIVTKGFIFFDIPLNCETLRMTLKRPSGATPSILRTFWFNNVELRKYQMLINPIRPAVGTIQEFAGPVANIPYGFLNCDGAAVSRSTYAKLFAVIGTTYGTGDGSTTFNLPNTQGIGLRGVGSQTYGGVTYSATLGQKRNDAIQNITGEFGYQGDIGSVRAGTGELSGVFAAGVSRANRAGDGLVGGGSHRINFNASRVARTDTQTHGADLAVNYMICFDDGPARYADYTLNQDVSFVGATNATQALTANVTNINLVSIKDTVGAWTGSTFVMKGSGDLSITGVLQATASSNVYLDVYVNGVTHATAGRFNSDACAISTKAFNLKDGDIVSLRVNGAVTLANNPVAKVFINKVATSQQLFAPIGPVTFRARNSSGQSVPSNTITTVTGWTLLDDTTNGAFNASTGIFTAPEDGFYAFGFTYTLNSQTFAVGATYDAIISSSTGKNVVMTNIISVANPVFVSPSVTSALFLPKGATVSPQVFFGSTGNKTLSTDQQRTIFYGYKVR